MVQSRRNGKTFGGYFQHNIMPGFKRGTMQNGAIQFEVPVDWVDIDRGTTLALYDRTPPANDSILEISILGHSAIALKGNPLAELIQGMIQNAGHTIPIEDIVVQNRDGMEIAWGEYRAMHETDHRMAIWRFCVVRTSRRHILITYALWIEEAVRLDPIWNHFLATFKVTEKP